jgi:hypothetical protein
MLKDYIIAMSLVLLSITIIGVLITQQTVFVEKEENVCTCMSNNSIMPKLDLKCYGDCKDKNCDINSTLSDYICVGDTNVNNS